mmetsp:Transcript_1184/g.4584  ORF Transcript_1184/g.4584 Transcript_1184/m.4584 type:complete len:135 (-) Transcript_1184:365-769(-)
MKTVERAHLPKQLWERIRLSRNYTKALKQLDKHLEFWPKLMVRLASARQRSLRCHCCLLPARVQEPSWDCGGSAGCLASQRQGRAGQGLYCAHPISVGACRIAFSAQCSPSRPCPARPASPVSCSRRSTGTSSA